MKKIKQVFTYIKNLDEMSKGLLIIGAVGSTLIFSSMFYLSSIDKSKEDKASCETKQGKYQVFKYGTICVKDGLIIETHD